MKKCSRCGVEKPISEFSKRSRSKDGLNPWCKSCTKEYDREYRAKHKDEISQKRKLQYTENREEILEKQKQYYHDNKDKYKEYRERNKEKIKEWQADYRKTHKNESQEYQRLYYKKNREHKLKYRRNKTRDIHKFKDKCVKCGETKPYMIDFHHIDPFDKDFEVSQIPTASNDRVKNELKKCVCLCRNCHAEFHWIYGAQPIDAVKSLEDYLGKNPYDLTIID